MKPRQKTPATRHGVKDATTNPAIIRRWWKEWPAANIGIACGKPSGIANIGLLVVDLDTPDSRDALLEHGELPTTLAATTGRGEHHYYYAPRAVSTTSLVSGVDTRGDGGYVAAPPSIHPNGSAYRWINAEQPVMIAPAWLVALTLKRRSEHRIELADARTQLAAAPHLEGELAALQRMIIEAPRGTRNVTAYTAAQAAHSLLRRGCARSELRTALQSACTEAGLDDDETRHALRSIT